MFFDRATNFKGVGIGEVLISESRQYYAASTKIRFSCTNNMAEYEACILGIRMAVNMDIKELLVIGDSDLLIHQVQEEWSTKTAQILLYLHCVKELCRKFIKIELKHIPRFPKDFADALATLPSMIQHLEKNYVDPTKEDPDLDLLRCVDATEATKLLEEIHVGTCRPHMNGFTLAKKSLRAGYFWMTMESDSIRYVQKFHKCQIHRDFLRVPLNELNVMGSPWPFAAWGMDVIGPMEHATSNIHLFILVAIVYFTKWVEASTYKAVIKKVVVYFVQNNIVYRFGISESIIIDNSTNLNSDRMREICEKFRIVNSNSTSYKPQMNGLSENHENIHWAMPYMLVYGTEAVIPAEVKIPSLRDIQEAKLDDAEWIRVRKEQLMLINEKIMDALCHGYLYQNRMASAFNKRVKPHQFTLGQLVLKKFFPHQEEAKGKFAPHGKVLTWFTENCLVELLSWQKWMEDSARSLSTQMQSRDTTPKDE
ncbi:uncharacterized protein [Nicotiana tomentosiformis]|uniref:uncharacterized protein n=1 Tax=Nicotiana tomentosiformis TaxID=4098 RepID=UPI00388C568B